MGTLADGDTSADIPYATNKDEIGGMVRAVQIFKDNMIATKALSNEQRANDLSTAASDLGEQSSTLKTAVDKFISQVHNAQK